MNVRIKKLSFIAGDSVSANPLELDSGTVTILVGPNNSGKSQALRDIEAICLDRKDYSQIIIKDIEMLGYPTSKNDTEQLLDWSMAYPQSNGDRVVFNDLYDDRTKHEKLSKETFEIIHTDEALIKKYIVTPYLILLKGRTRFKLVDPEKDSQSHVIGSHLRFLSKDRLEKLNAVIKDTFNKYIIPQRSHYSNDIKGEMVRLKVSDQLPPFELMKDRETNEEIIKIENPFYDSCELLTQQGDGIQAFVGIMSALLVRPQTIILIDEPEAFLAPSIAKRLGKELTKIAKEREASLIVATHSADFVMGCIEVSENPSIVRLTYQNQKATAREVEAEVIEKFNTNPCLRSSAAIRGLFHKGIIVTEGHRDRIFYDEVNRRLFEKCKDKDKDKGMGDALFIDSGGGISLIYKTIAPLRKMGVPAVAIVDLDLITEENKSAWDNLLKACQIGEEGIKELGKRKEIILEALNKKEEGKVLENLQKKGQEILKDLDEAKNLIQNDLTNKNWKNINETIKSLKKINLKSSLKEGGIKELDTNDQVKAKDFIEFLANYGLFVIPTGELESWVPGLKKYHKWDNSWLEQLKFPLEDNSYDWWGWNIWSFMQKITEWINDSNKKGIN